jgi:hypothetical protein
MERTWALVKDAIVENVIVWDGASDWSPPADCILVETTNIDPAPGPGWTYADGVFTTLEEPDEPEQEGA